MTQLRHVTDIKECEVLWERYSPHETLWDEWFCALPFYVPETTKPHFIVVSHKDKEVGLLPLWHDKELEAYYFFGGSYPEDHSFWFPLKHAKDVFASVPGKLRLLDVRPEAVVGLEVSGVSVTPDDPHYVVDLVSLQHNPESMLSFFSKKHRKNFRRDIAAARDGSLTESWGTFDDLEHFFDFNVQRFGVESDYSDPVFQRQVLSFFHELAFRDSLHTLVLRKGDKVVGVEVGAFFKGRYYLINGGYNHEFPNVGKLLIWAHLERACKLKASVMDCLVGDTGWKKLWNIPAVPYVTVSKEG